MKKALQYRIEFPTKLNRVFPIHYPEIRLAALLVVSIKLCFPLSGKRSPFTADDAPILPAFDWKVWYKIWSKANPKEPESGDILDSTPDEVASMSDDNFTAYLEQVASFVDKKSTWDELCKRLSLTASQMKKRL